MRRRRERFGPYEIVRRLGVGGMAEAFAAIRHDGADEEVCLKRILPAYADNEDFRKMFASEASIARRVRHPNIVELRDYGEIEGTYYIAFELVDGVDLRRLLRALESAGERLDPVLAIYVAREIARALDAVHTVEDEDAPLGLVHRDVSPGNVLLSSAGHVKLADFGVAKAMNSSGTVSGIVKGKPSYMPIEQLELDADARSDLFALGVVAYEMVAGRRPFDGGSDLQTMRNVMEGSFVPLADAAPDAPRAFAALVDRLLARERDARIQTAAEVVAELEPLVTDAREPLGALVGRFRPDPTTRTDPTQAARHGALLGQARYVPLRYRLPAAPIFFEGRDDEVARLQAMIERGPVSVVVGLGGLGKTSLAVATLHRMSEIADRPTVFLTARSTRRAELVWAAARALSAATGPLSILPDAAHAPDPDRAMSVFVDVAESVGACVVFDNLEDLGATDSVELIRDLAAYLRDARVIVTSRIDPCLPELAGQVLALSGLGASTMARLVAACAPSLDRAAVDEVVRRSAGSPWRARHLLGASSHEFGDEITAGLDAASVELLETLLVLEQPVARAALERVDPRFTRALVRALEQRSFIQVEALGVQLTGLARELLGERRQTARIAQAAERAVRMLETSSDPEDAVEVIRLLLGASEIDRALPHVEQHLDDVIGAGLGGSLWRALEPIRDPRFTRAKLSCAVATADREPIAWAVGLPEPEDARSRILWAYALRLKGENERALEALRRIRTGELDASDRFAVAHAESIALYFLRRIEEALAVSRAAVPASVDDRAMQLAHTARVLVIAEQMEEATRLLAEVETLLPHLSPPTRRSVLEVSVQAFVLSGHIREGTRLLEELSGSARLHGRTPAERGLRCMLACEAGNLRDIPQLIEAWYGTSESPFRRFNTHYFDALCAIASGDFERARSRLERMRVEAIRLNDGACAVLAKGAQALYAVNTGVVLDCEGLDLPSQSLSFVYFYEETERVRRVRRGEPTVPRDPATLDQPNMTAALRVSGLRSAGEEVLRDGDTDDAIRLLVRAHDRAIEFGRRVDQAEICTVLAEAYVMAGHGPGTRAMLRELAAELEALARDFPSRRFELEAKWIRATAGDEVDLDELAAAESNAPIAARRASALLGRPANLDARDRQVLERLRDAPAREDTGELALSERTREVVLPNGRRASLAKSEMCFAVLRELVRAGDVVTKETLAARVWEVREYHPLRDDKRLQMTVGRLRARLAEAGAAGELVLTVQNGYRLGVRARMVE
jgi:tetratricopeptide (TPR) repeat protein